MSEDDLVFKEIYGKYQEDDYVRRVINKAESEIKQTPENISRMNEMTEVKEKMKELKKELAKYKNIHSTLREGVKTQNKTLSIKRKEIRQQIALLELRLTEIKMEQQN